MPEGMSKDMSERMSEDMAEDMSEGMSKTMSEKMSKDLSERLSERMSCQKICQKEGQKICQKECQKICQKECQKICQKDCQKICQKDCQKICQAHVRRCQKECRVSGGMSESLSVKLRVTGSSAGNKMYVSQPSPSRVFRGKANFMRVSFAASFSLRMFRMFHFSMQPFRFSILNELYRYCKDKVQGGKQ